MKQVEEWMAGVRVSECVYVCTCVCEDVCVSE